MRGFYAAFEGNDGTGKTTTMDRVAARITTELGEQFAGAIELTHHPGSTPLGQHIRRLVKFPELIDPAIKIDGLSRQTLYIVDTISFVKTLLEPSLASGRIVLADRNSFISAMVYGLAEGLELKQIEQLLSLVAPPKVDRLYVLSCPWNIGRERVLNSRAKSGSDQVGALDHFDRKPAEFYATVADLYDNLIVKSPELTALVSRFVAVDDIIHVDASLPLHQVEEIIATDMVRTIRERCVASPAD